MSKTAILVDGGFYRRRAQSLWGDKPSEERAKEVIDYCQKHLYETHGKKDSKHTERHELYRIFYYDCPPTDKKIYHPFTKKQIDFGRSELHKWMSAFLEKLKEKRKVALRLGILADTQAHYNIDPATTKKLCNGSMQWHELEEKHFRLFLDQKGVDMKIGVDIASLAYKKQVDRIVLISGDSDFVPASKLARREGIDFVLDPMWATIKPELFEHIDGLRSCSQNPHKGKA